MRELTFGWPAEAERVEGPEIALRWRSTVDVRAALEAAFWPDVANLVRLTKLAWLDDQISDVEVETELCMWTAELNGRALIEKLALSSRGPDGSTHRASVAWSGRGWACEWDGEAMEHISVDFDHFLPFFELDRQNLGPRHRERAYHTGFKILFEQPLEDLKRVLEQMQYLGSARVPPPSIYRPTSAPPDELGVGGEYAAALIHAHQADVIHHMPALEVSDLGVTVADEVHATSFVEAVNHVLAQVGVDGTLRVEDVPNVGFRLLFGDANLPHVGRGLTYLLPIIELGLFADPLRFRGERERVPRDVYVERCPSVTHIAFEEPEAHIHPKVQSRLAHWMVALAMSNRQLIVETHSDHLVRRLRGLMARAGAGSELERWLRDSVSIIEVEQRDGRSTLVSSRLTPAGSIADHWPADFMDEASEEESAIYYAALDKPTAPRAAAPSVDVTHDEGEEPELEEEP